jgi:hypothetical protein
MSTQRRKEELQRYPGAIIPEARLYRPDEVYVTQEAHLVASQRPMFRVRHEPRKEVRQALGFPQIDPEIVIAHFDTLINL